MKRIFRGNSKKKKIWKNFAVKSFENHGNAIKEEILKIAMRANLENKAQMIANGDCASITSL